VLSTPTLPPISSASSRQIDSPSPVPPKRRVVDSSACVKALNRRACVAPSMPGPVSLTSKRTNPASMRRTAKRRYSPLGEFQRVASGSC
jgi:hypothetical protein